jgi:hypothetical protein
MPIKGLKPRLALLGYIKAGGLKEVTVRGEKRRIPEKWDHFIVTTADRDETNYTPDVELMEKLSANQDSEDKKVRRISVFLPSNDINEIFVTGLGVYDGKGVRCRNTTAEDTADYIDPNTQDIKKVACPCRMLRVSLEGSSVDAREAHPYLTPDIQRGQVCKMHGLLRVMIVEANNIGGIHIFRTTSTTSIEQLHGALSYIKDITGGLLASIPLELSLRPKRVKPEASQSRQTVYVADLTYSAGHIEFLRLAAERSETFAHLRNRIASRDLAALPAPGFEDPEEQRHVAEEYMGTDSLEEDGSVIDGEGEEISEPKEQPATQPPKETKKPEPPKKQTPPPQDESPPPPSDEDAPPEATSEKKSETKQPAPETSEQTPLDKQPPQQLDDKGFPVIVNAEPPGADKSPASKDIRKNFIQAGHSAGFTDLELRDWIKKLWDVESTAKLETWQVTTMTAELNRKASS